MTNFEKDLTQLRVKARETLELADKYEEVCEDIFNAEFEQEQGCEGLQEVISDLEIDKKELKSSLEELIKEIKV